MPYLYAFLRRAKADRDHSVTSKVAVLAGRGRLTSASRGLACIESEHEILVEVIKNCALLAWALDPKLFHVSARVLLQHLPKDALGSGPIDLDPAA